tara:strand:- start:587 stop:778 length:192 start_codon:yes stop_codon:yes gene_type:complete
MKKFISIMKKFLLDLKKFIEKYQILKIIKDYQVLIGFLILAITYAWVSGAFDSPEEPIPFPLY